MKEIIEFFVFCFFMFALSFYRSRITNFFQNINRCFFQILRHCSPHISPLYNITCSWKSSFHSTFFPLALLVFDLFLNLRLLKSLEPENWKEVWKIWLSPEKFLQPRAQQIFASYIYPFIFLRYPLIKLSSFVSFLLEVLN